MNGIRINTTGGVTTIHELAIYQWLTGMQSTARVPMLPLVEHLDIAFAATPTSWVVPLTSYQAENIANRPHLTGLKLANIPLGPESYLTILTSPRRQFMTHLHLLTPEFVYFTDVTKVLMEQIPNFPALVSLGFVVDESLVLDSSVNMASTLPATLLEITVWCRDLAKGLCMVSNIIRQCPLLTSLTIHDCRVKKPTEKQESEFLWHGQLRDTLNMATSELKHLKKLSVTAEVGAGIDHVLGAFIGDVVSTSIKVLDFSGVVVGDACIDSLPKHTPMLCELILDRCLHGEGQQQKSFPTVEGLRRLTQCKHITHISLPFGKNTANLIETLPIVSRC